MSDKTAPPPEGVLSRWARVKRETRQRTAPQQHAAAPSAAAEPPVPETPPLTDADMPPLEALTQDSDLAPFLSSGVSSDLKRKAFRKIFLGQRFNIRDGLDDYDDDFTGFAPLGDIVTAEYRRWRRRYDDMQEQWRKEEEEAAPAAASSPDDEGGAAPEADAAAATPQQDDDRQ